MPRHEQDEWDITSSVGLTALAVAGARAIESKRNASLITDRYADMLVSAAATRMAAPTRLPIPRDAHDEQFEDIWSQVATGMGIRTRFFDEFFATCWVEDLTQAVILASGLDARAWRLNWPEHCMVFEIDQPRVLAFKDEVFAQKGAEQRCGRRAVAIDLRHDWPTALNQAGFDRARPTAWLAEGLLPYLSEDAEARLLAAVHELSAPGSRIALEHIRSPQALLDNVDDRVAQMVNRFGIDIADLTYDNDTRPDPDERLTELGWQTTVTIGTDVATAYDRTLDGLAKQLGEQQRYITARLIQE